MALNDYDNKRQYTKYKRHVNESHERVDAGTVNTLQDDLNVQQKETNEASSSVFSGYCSRTFVSHCFLFH